MSKLKIITWNIRGLGKSEKIRAVSRLVLIEKPAILLLQESKLNVCRSGLTRKLGGNLLRGSCFVPADGSAGGLICLWNENDFEVSAQINSGRFMALSGKFKMSNFECVIINVYGPSVEADKEEFFRDFLCAVQSINLPVCLGGDFNAYLDPEEKCGFTQNWHSMDLLRSFIQSSNLMDLPLVGGRFTWSNNRESTTWFPNVIQKMLPKSLSDHNPVLLVEECNNWGPKPFRFYNYMLQEDGFVGAVESSLSNLRRATGRGDFLSRTGLDDCCEEGVWNLHRKEESIWLQRSRVAEEVISEPDQLRGFVFNYFKDNFNSVTTLEVDKINLPFAKLTDDQKKLLEVRFSEQEVWEAVFHSDSAKAPGPDVSQWTRNPEGIEDYRPISLVGSLYKIISKVLARRLAAVISVLVSPSQFAFIPGRQLLDCVFLANEVIDDWRKKERKGVVFKVDFRRAYDSVEWPILLRLLRIMGFGNRWLSWIELCISSASISVLVNGSPTNEFKMGKG
ncbi:uncharacterized protein LOC120182600, partial [Hibiscus syriacus]|uniref:uncharacterized protein LOC120182600 n=1 Tax=Hibiscus syriacus TaxID=106335 RepID=UPI0019216F1F